MSQTSINLTTDDLYKILCEDCVRKLDELMGRKIREAKAKVAIGVRDVFDFWEYTVLKKHRRNRRAHKTGVQDQPRHPHRCAKRVLPA